MSTYITTGSSTGEPNFVFVYTLAASGISAVPVAVNEKPLLRFQVHLSTGMASRRRNRR